MNETRFPGLSSAHDETLELDYWYDAQIRRYLIQFVRMFSTIRVRSNRRDGRPVYRRVPVRLATSSRQVAWMLQRANENRMLSIPQMVVRIEELRYSEARRVAPYHREKNRFYERPFDPATQEYVEGPPNRWTVEHHMPVPYDMVLDLDVWTSNLDQKLQIFEQIAMVFNPAVDVYSSESPLDWGALSWVRLTDFSWNGPAYPLSPDEFDVMTFRFEMPVFVSPPMRIEPQKVITEIIGNVMDGRRVAEYGLAWAVGVRYEPADMLARIPWTASGYWIRIDGDEVRLLGPDASETKDDGSPWLWSEVLEKAPGQYVPGETQLLLVDPLDIEDYDGAIRGTLDDGPDDSVKFWAIDPTTLPAETLSPIDAAIDPHASWPGNGLPPASDGRRYLLLDSVANAVAWPGLDARAGDIVEYTGGTWLRSFVAVDRGSEIHIVRNTASGRLLRWNGQEWSDLIDGDHSPGLWRLAFARPVALYGS